MHEDDEDKRTYSVVVNDEGQHSIWAVGTQPPPGWREVGKVGRKAECLAHVEQVWLDMRPRSLQKRMAELANNPEPEPAASPGRPRHPLGKNDLVERLETPHSVEAALRPEKTLEVLKQQLERGHVLMRVVKTGTELGIRVDRGASEVRDEVLSAGRGRVKIVGDLTLNGNRVRYSGDLDIETMAGMGQLEFIREVLPGEA